MTTSIKIENLATRLHQVLNAHYVLPIDREEAMVKMGYIKINEAGVNDNK